MDSRLAQQIDRVQERIVAAARRAGRDPAEVTLVAVSKLQSAETVAAAYAAGLRLFGENRVEEAGPKAQAVAALIAPRPLPAWHMIGHLQSRKADEVLPWASMVHSVDSVKLAARLNRFILARRDWEAPSGEASAGSPGPQAQPAKASIPEGPLSIRPNLPILLEVNISGETSKQGFRPADLPGAVETIAALPGLCVEGLMTMAPIVAAPEEARPIFAALRMLRDDLARNSRVPHLHHLSMGMTDDFEIAIEEGATLVRVGRAIFGE